MNDWIHTGETETGLQIWIKQNEVDGVKYLRYQYRNKDSNEILYTGDIPFKQARLLNSLVDILETKYGK